MGQCILLGGEKKGLYWLKVFCSRIALQQIRKKDQGVFLAPNRYINRRIAGSSFLLHSFNKLLM